MASPEELTRTAEREAHGRVPGALADLGLAMACAVLVMGALLAAGGIWWHVAGDDLHGMFLPKFEYAGRAARGLRLPLWNRDEFCGLPLLGAGQGAVLYPPVFLLFGGFEPWTALQAFYALHVFLLAWGMRRYLASHGVGLMASSVAAVVTTAGLLSPWQRSLDHPSSLASVTWVPLALLAYERAVREGLRPWLGLLGVALGLEWLCGYPDYSLDTAVVLGLRALLDRGEPFGRRLGVAAAGLALGGALAAIQILPVAETVGESIRAGRTYTLGHGAILHLGVFTRATIFEHTVPGLLAVALGLGAPIRGRLAWAACLTWCLLPWYWPFALLYRLPPFSAVRFPLGWRSLAYVFTGCLAGAGIELLRRRRGRVARAAAAALALWIAALATTRIVRAQRMMPLRAEDRALADERASRLLALQAANDRPRILSTFEARTGSLLRHDLTSPGGYEPGVPPRRMVALLDAVGSSWGGQRLAYDRLAMHAEVGALLGVGIVTAPPPASRLVEAGFRPLGPLPGGDLVLYRPPVPRARLVHRAVRVVDESASLAHVVEHAGEAPEGAVVEAALPFALAEPVDGATERATIVVDEPEHLEVETVVAAPALLVVTDAFYPGWEATVDGVRVPIARADHAFRAVALAPGARRVRFVYAPASVRRGAVLSGAAALIVLALCLPMRRRSRAA